MPYLISKALRMGYGPYHTVLLPPTHISYLPLLPSCKASAPFGWYSLRLPTKGWPGWLHRNKCSAPELNPDTVTHPGTNLAPRRLTSLIETNALSLRQTTTNYVTYTSRELHGDTFMSLSTSVPMFVVPIPTQSPQHFQILSPSPPHPRSDHPHPVPSGLYAHPKLDYFTAIMSEYSLFLIFMWHRCIHSHC